MNPTTPGDGHSQDSETVIFRYQPVNIRTVCLARFFLHSAIARTKLALLSIAATCLRFRGTLGIESAF
jgi:hypothetical protein